MAHISSNKSTLGVSEKHRERRGRGKVSFQGPARKAEVLDSQSRYKTMRAKVQEHEDNKEKLTRIAAWEQQRENTSSDTLEKH